MNKVVNDNIIKFFSIFFFILIALTKMKLIRQNGENDEKEIIILARMSCITTFAI